MDDLDKFIQNEIETNPQFKEEWATHQFEYDLMHTLLQARLEQNMTQKDLAAKTGLRQSNISRIESGQCHPNIYTLAKIAKGLGKHLKIQFV